MPSIATWKKLQAISGLVFACFLLLHLVCHYSLSVGWDYAQETLLQMRAIYQQPAVEAGLGLATLVHLTSNTVIIAERGKIDAINKKDGGNKKEPAGTHELNFHRYAGYFLAFAIFGHVGVTRIAPYYFLEDPSQFDYSFLAAVGQLFPMIRYPFYFLMIMNGVSGIWHMIYGTRSALTTLLGGSVVGTPFPFLLKFLAILNYLLIISAVLAMNGYYYYVDTESKAELHQQINDSIGIH